MEFKTIKECSQEQGIGMLETEGGERVAPVCDAEYRVRRSRKAETRGKKAFRIARGVLLSTLYILGKLGSIFVLGALLIMIIGGLFCWITPSVYQGIYAFLRENVVWLLLATAGACAVMAYDEKWSAKHKK